MRENIVKSVPNPEDVGDLDYINVTSGLDNVNSGDIDSAAKEIGLTVLSGRTLKAAKKLGRFLSPSDVVHIKVSSLFRTDERIEHLENLCDTVFSEAQDDEMRLTALRLARELVSERLKSTQIAVDIATKHGDLVQKKQEAARPRGFAVGEVVTPVQVNIKADGNVSVSQGASHEE